ncbi:hypothetical protein AB9P05_20345 [Roseivirga sp. BDSF3-8]|uniref:hypothetical protein n=1 Tax=Roseivirga sp. BDSF3-8 TaxID=3241598 RepID=UPI00353253EE
MKNLALRVSLDEANLIMKALGELPFKDVYELIGKLNEQANNQLKPGEKENEKDSSGYSVGRSDFDIDKLLGDDK